MKQFSNVAKKESDSEGESLSFFATINCQYTITLID